ncbi:MAG: hypothetical protein EGQ30_05610, partial [Clostridiales bacterium]|nr:hypothetical protein [Clostridiales bacterium]
EASIIVLHKFYILIKRGGFSAPFLFVLCSSEKKSRQKNFSKSYRENFIFSKKQRRFRLCFGLTGR